MVYTTPVNLSSVSRLAPNSYFLSLLRSKVLQQPILLPNYAMGRIVTSVRINNPSNGGNSKLISALVDTGASYLTLPLAWKTEFGGFASEAEVDLQTATQAVVRGTVCGPALIAVDGFRAVHNEVLFIDMQPSRGEYEPLLGYLVLEQCGVNLDMLGQRLVAAKYMDLKSVHTATKI